MRVNPNATEASRRQASVNLRIEEVGDGDITCVCRLMFRSAGRRAHLDHGTEGNDRVAPAFSVAHFSAQ